jgi:hypothetical protein
LNHGKNKNTRTQGHLGRHRKCSAFIPAETFQEITHKEFEAQQGESMESNQEECYEIFALVIKPGKSHEDPYVK